MTKCIAHFGTFDVPNYGDLLFPLVLERRLAGLGFDFAHVSPCGGKPVWGDCVSSISLDDLIDNASTIVAVAVGGGNLINFGATSLEQYQQGGLAATLAYPRLWMEPAVLAEARGLPLWWNGPGVSEPILDELCDLAKWAASAAHYVAVRDDASKRWLQRTGFATEINIIPDTALEVSQLWSPEEVDDAYAEAFARRQRSLPCSTLAIHLNGRFTQESAAELAGRLDRICASRQTTAVLLALGPCHGDSKLQREVGERMKSNPLIVDQPNSLRELAACIARSEAYLGSSLHGCITACSFGKKALVVVPRTAPTRHKFVGFLRMFGLSEWLAESWFEAEQRFEQLHTASVNSWQQVLQKALPRLDQHWSQVCTLIQNHQRPPASASEALNSKNPTDISRQPPAVGKSYSAPLELLIRHHALRCAATVRQLRQETQKRKQNESNVAALRAELLEVESSLKSVTSDMAKLKIEFAALDEEKNIAGAQFERERKDVAATINNLKKQLIDANHYKQVHDDERRKRERLEARLEELQAQHHSTCVSLTGAERALQRAQMELVGERRKTAARHHEWRLRIDELAVACTQVQDALAVSEDHARELRKESVDLKNQLGTAQVARSVAEAHLGEATKTIEYLKLVLGVRDAVDAWIRPGATVAIISKGDEQLLRLGARTAWHFPRNERGAYLGYHPANGTDVVEQLRSQWLAGAEFFVVPRIFRWWLEYYGELGLHLKANAECICEDETCSIFRLPPRPRSPLNRLLSQVIARGGQAVSATARLIPQRELRTTQKELPAMEISNAREPIDDSRYQDVVRGVQSAVDRWVPAENVVAVVSKGDDDLLRFHKHRGWHFPQTEQGVYTGYHPASDSDAIDYLEAARKRGANTIVFPRTSWWWFDHYQEFGAYLRARYRWAGGDQSCFVFDLSTMGWMRRMQASVSAMMRPRSSGQLSPKVRYLASNEPTGVDFLPPAEPLEKPLNPGLITVVIPVYNAAEDVKGCLESLVRHTLHPHQILLIDDCSPDSTILPLLHGYAKNYPHIHLRHNPVNRGFTRTVNIGCRLAPADVVLLNSDTQVTPGWLEKLAACAMSRDHVATVTPLSNAAGAFSVPQNNTVNQIPAPLTCVDVGRLVERLSKRIRPSVPTGNGFCMYVTRRSLNVIGRFDERNFPRGYGEENDFCMRAISRGFVNLIDDSTYIFHRRGASFLDARNELMNQSRETLRRLHPTYKRDVSRWLQNDPLDGLRAELRARLEHPEKAHEKETDRPCLLFMIHAGKGGTLLTNADLINELSRDFRCLVLKTDLNHWTLHECQDGGLIPIRRYAFSLPWQVQQDIGEERTKVLEDICGSFHVQTLHVRHLLGSGPDALHCIDALGIPIVMSFHDYYTVCPTIQLIDDRGKYCAGKCTASDGDCTVARSWFRGEVPVMKHQFVHVHRRRMASALKLCKAFVTTCESARQTLQDAFPFLGEADFHVIEHGRNITHHSTSDVPSTDGPVRVVCLGNIDRAKGSELIEGLMTINRQLGNRFEFHFLGNRASTFNPEALGGVCHGTYERDELPQVLREIRPAFSLIASIWPETYCHTLTESWAAGLPVLASNLGALKERIERAGGGWLLDPTYAEAWYHKMVEVIDTPRLYEQALREIAAIEHRSVEEMASDYRKIYKKLGVGQRSGSMPVPA